MTISKYVWMPPSIADAQIVCATAAAAAIYGYGSPRELEGRFLSQTMDEEDMRRGSLYSLARRHGHGAPTEYVTRIRRPNTDYVYVNKKVTQIESNDSIWWVTELTEALPPPSPLYKPTPQELDLSNQDVIAYLGTMTMSGLEALITHRISGAIGLSDLTNSSMHNIIFALRKSRRKTDDSDRPEAVPDILGDPVTLGPGESRQLPDDRWLHRCGRCSSIWMSQQALKMKPVAGRTELRWDIWHNLWEPSVSH
ncbi:MAG: hypothetical protein ETSY1_18495 [Candidatus Entotheonella factor]|uniref:Uncharacterized protein n=1 Tax=Entotheonella factor TaxID=1429438 RepID=W4LK62_ENTF1|nr:MAG: hypothetical protein ETSY1_18495 [Candidatus Entotheonella factor]